MLLAGFRTYFTILPRMNPQTNDLYVCVQENKRLGSTYKYILYLFRYFELNMVINGQAVFDFCLKKLNMIYTF